MASLWEKRGATQDPARWSSAALAATASGKWDDNADQAAIRALIDDPRFINELWERGDPSSRVAMIDRLLDRMANECPAKLLPVLEKSEFDLSHLRSLAGSLAMAAHVAPEDTFLMLKATSGRIAPEAFNRAMDACASYPASARKLLEDLATGAAYPDYVINRACSRVLNADGELPAAAAKLEAVQKLVRTREEQRRFQDWLKEGNPITTEEMAAMNKESLAASLQTAIYQDTVKIDASQLELLGASGHLESQSSLLTMMVNSGRADEAARLLKEAQDLPATKGNLDELYQTLASSIFESSGDIGKTVSLVNGIGDEAKYWKAVTGVLSEWASADPAGVKQYLPQIGDQQLRSDLEKIINRVSVSP